MTNNPLNGYQPEYAYIGAGRGGRRQCGQPRTDGGSGKEARTPPRKRFVQSYGRNTPRRCRACIRARSVAKTRLFKQKRLCAASGRRARRSVIHNRSERKSRRRRNAERQQVNKPQFKTRNGRSKLALPTARET